MNAIKYIGLDVHLATISIAVLNAVTRGSVAGDRFLQCDGARHEDFSELANGLTSESRVIR
jgi:hypothetical protein